MIERNSIINLEGVFEELVMVEIQTDQSDPLKSIICALFDLSAKQYQCFKSLQEIGAEGTCITNLVKQLASERSLVQKQIKCLLDKGLVKREMVSLSDFNTRCKNLNLENLEKATNKGYLYLYKVIDREILAEKVKTLLKDWQDTVDEFLC